MKPNETSLNTMDPITKTNIDLIGDDHIGNFDLQPLRPDAFLVPDDQKIALIAEKFKDIMDIMGMDLTDDSLKGTPLRVAKMYINEIFSGLNPANKPEITLFENKYKYQQMLIERDIVFYSCCEHHFQPFFGKAHVAYISTGKVIGLSKLNRIVQYYAQRPQVQERLTKQIAKEIATVLETDDVAVKLEAAHLCVSSRGIKDTHSSTVTVDYLGKFASDPQKRNEFLSLLER